MAARRTRPEPLVGSFSALGDGARQKSSLLTPRRVASSEPTVLEGSCPGKTGLDGQRYRPVMFTACDSEGSCDMIAKPARPHPRRAGSATPPLDMWAQESQGEPTMGQRIAAFFDPHGVLAAHSPKHWALAASQSHPLSCSAARREASSRIPERQQSINALRTLQKDQMRRDIEVKRVCQEHQLALSSSNRIVQDGQHQRQLLMLFESQPEALARMPNILQRELRIEGVPRASTRKCTGKLLRLKGLTWMTIGVNSPSFQPTLSRVQTSQSQEDNVAPLSASLDSKDWANLFSIYQRYVQRVAGLEEKDLMTRSTWFRFLHHCGLLGPDGGVAFSEGAALYDKFSEGSAGIFTLPFSNWVMAIQHIQQVAKERMPHEKSANFFGQLLTRCEARLSDKHGASPSKRGSARSVSSFSWQCAAAEEQMCEPEVLQLLHDFHEPLKLLFAHYGVRVDKCRPNGHGRAADHREAAESEELFPVLPPEHEASEESDASLVSAGAKTPADTARGSPLLKRERRPGSKNGSRTASRAGSRSGSRMRGSPCLRSGAQARRKGRRRCCKSLRITTERFLEMLHDLKLFPRVVQQHSAKQHLSVTLSRRGASELTYTAFIECLFRIAFVYLSFYGNPVQQQAPSKWKCIWMLALICIRCQEVGVTDDAANAWQYGPHCSLDTLSLQHLVLWRALDAGCSRRSWEGQALPKLSLSLESARSRGRHGERP